LGETPSKNGFFGVEHVLPVQSAGQHQLAQLSERDRRGWIKCVLAIKLAQLEQQYGKGLHDDEDEERPELLGIRG